MHEESQCYAWIYPEEPEEVPPRTEKDIIYFPSEISDGLQRHRMGPPPQKGRKFPREDPEKGRSLDQTGLQISIQSDRNAEIPGIRKARGPKKECPDPDDV